MKIKNLISLSVVALAAMLFAPAPGSAQVLLTAANYALLGGTAITVGGPGPNPIVNGNVGLSSSATTNITGFPPAVVSGFTVSGSPAGIIPTGGATGQAGADLITARNALFAMPHIPANDLSNLDIGTLAALRPGVYFSTSATNQTGAIVLDANFQNGVAWVFDFSLSLTTAANSTVTIINAGTNGGKDDGLFWNAATAITIGDNNTVLGNYMAGTSISFTGITNTLASGGVRALAGAAVTFAGKVPGGFNTTGGPGGGDFNGGLMYVGGVLVPIPPPVPPIVPPVIPPPPVFTGNVILSSTGLYVPGSSGVILVPGTQYPTSTLTLDGNSSNGSAPASLTINTATVTMTGTGNTYTGGTIVNSGVLIATSQTLPVNGSIALNTSILTFNQPASGTFGGVISGNGTVNKQGAGTTTFTGANTYTGGTNVSAGTLIASTSTLPVNGGVAILPVGTLVFNQAADGTFGGLISGGGKVQKTGTAAFTLTTATTSPVDVQAGSFFFNNGLGATTVSAGALLGGNGNVIGLLTNNGTVSPGNSPGTINVTGNYVQGSTGKLLVEIASVSSFDHLIITGTAALAGTLQVDILGGYNPLGQSFTFLTAAGGVSGTFGSLAGFIASSAATGVTVSYAPTSATITFTQLPFAGFAQTPNQAAVGAAAQGNPTQTAALDALPFAIFFPGSLNAMSPQGYQVWSDFAFARATSLADRLLREDRAVAGHDEYYFEANRAHGRSRADLDVGSSLYTSDSGLIGGNHLVRPGTTVGAYFAFGKTTSGLGSVGSETTVNEKTLGVRAGWVDGPMFVDAMLAYSFNDYSATRPIVFPGTAALATASTSGHQWTTGITAGEHLKAGAVTVSPFGGLLMTRWSANRFTEQGAGEFDATVGHQAAFSLRSQLGAEARMTLGLFQPHVRAAWLHEFYDDSRRIGASFGNINYSVKTRRNQRDTALYTAGLDVVLGPNALLYADVDTQSGGTTRVLDEWRLGVAITF
ncbi:autotransporter domain-containing protein [Opitutus sp. GAS368]|uniref:autotransporter family protein n=1 Tax=Opitutus sp. GAS368 TaxID=1882749 RepID=UPI00087D4898|nr:autotransporter domain-containing protein [Opitutus sp. GAS368]SDS12520.1 autotransporter-associated beta strand repeat-containing protein [Opitutus sp. GAS368]